MGIPKFYGWLKDHELFSSAIIEESMPSNIDIFAIDLNGLIHLNAGRIFGSKDDRDKQRIGQGPATIQSHGLTMVSQQDMYFNRHEIFRGVFRDIIGLTKTVKPTRSLIIAVDGVAPQAKINQQRNRRYKSATERKPTQLFDSNSITPGTDFMREFDHYMRQELNRIVQVDQTRGVRDPYAQILPPHIVYSSHLVPGEGEHKIADQLRLVKAQGQSVVVYGADADLIMIYLLHLRQGWNNIYLFRENKYNYAVKAMIDLRAIERIVVQLYPGVSSPVDDFVTMLFLIGNDFLPHFPVFERINDALTTLVAGYFLYLQESPGMGITDETNINWGNFGLFIQWVTERYNDELLTQWAQNTDSMLKFPSLLAQKCMRKFQRVIGSEGTCILEFDVPQFNQEWYKYVFSSKVGKGEVTPTELDKSRMVISYLEGLSWVYNYYKYGQANVNVGWYYPYHYSPLFSDLYPKIQEGVVWENNPLYIHSDFLTPIEQIVMVLPPGSLLSVPEPLRMLYGEQSPIYDLMPLNFFVDNQGKMEDWQAVAILPIPTQIRVKRAVEILNLSPEFKVQYAFTDDVVINRDMSKTFTVKKEYRGRGRGYPPRGGYSSEGRGYTTRGGYSSGRGYLPRGRGYTTRGNLPRGRGYAPRGNYQSERGRGYTPRGGYERGRGYTTYHRSAKPNSEYERSEYRVRGSAQ